MLSFRKIKQLSSLIIVKVSFTVEQENSLKTMLKNNPELMASLKENWFDSEGRYVSKHDSLLETLLLTVKTKNNILFPRDRFMKENNNGFVYESLLNVEAAKQSSKLFDLMNEAGMGLTITKPVLNSAETKVF